MTLISLAMLARRAPTLFASRGIRIWVLAAWLIGLWLVPATARAQVGFGQPGAGPPAGAPPGPPPGTGASTGVPEGQALPTEPATLPEDPTAIPPAVQNQIGTDADEDVEKGRGVDTDIDWYGLYYAEESRKYRFRTIIPLWLERTQPGDRSSMFGPLYFQRRSTDVDQDIVFPFFWKLRDLATYTTIIGPWMHQETHEGDDDPPGHQNWLAPLYFEGSNDVGDGYLHIPPLLTFTQHSDHDGFNLVGPMFCSWRGGPACDPRSTDEIDLGFAPLYFYGKDRTDEYELIPPLLHYYSYSDVGDSEFNLWGPLVWTKDREGGAFNFMPIYWHNWGENEDHTTVFPFFHYGYKGESTLLATPLFVHANGENGESTFVTWGYARHRGRTELDMITPLYWNYRDPDIGLDRTYLLPFYYRDKSPRDNDIMLFPFYANFEKPAIKESWWVTPIFRHERSLTGWSTNVHPILFLGRENRSTHLVVAPIIWDFASPRSRQTVVLPAFFRFADQSTTSQLVLNTYYHEERTARGRDWEFHLFPFFSYGESPDGHWWNFLYGLAGYTRDGTMSKMRALFIPIELSK